MEELFIKEIKINQVRHLKDVEIPISDTERKHLILTGKNGSGKTSVLLEIKEAIKIILLQHDEYLKLDKEKKDLENKIQDIRRRYKGERGVNKITKTKGENKYLEAFEKVQTYDTEQELEKVVTKIKKLEKINLNSPIFKFFALRLFKKGELILASFNAKRNGQLNIPEGPKKIKFKNTYNLDDSVSANFWQYILNLKADRSFAKDDNDVQVVKEVDFWFIRFVEILKFIFDDEKLDLVFDRKNDYNFNIVLENGQIMPFNALSDGYSAILNIVMELMLRMEGKVKNVYDIQGIVLIDEVETHLHIDLQKKILPFLTSFFPKIQFIVSTHSPFVISSLSNAVVYDLENHTRFEDLSEYPIDGIVEGYFDNDKYSAAVTKKIAEYEVLTEKDMLTEAEEKRRFQLFKDLNDVSGKLAPELKLKFQQIQLKRLAKSNG